VKRTGSHHTLYFPENDSLSCLAHYVILDNPINPAVVTLYIMGVMSLWRFVIVVCLGVTNDILFCYNHGFCAAFHRGLLD
jgi:hypothetical protein